MSELKVGPKIKKDFGFDIVVYSKMIMFAMEYCSQGQQFTLKTEEDLKQSLAVMHLLNIVHLDIKPTNIAFSNQYKKWVFIDFGFTTVVE